MDRENIAHETTQSVCVEIPHQLIQYLQNVDQRIEEEHKREIQEPFKNIRCFQNILGTSTSFKLHYNRSFFGTASIIIQPQNFGSLPIKVYRNSAPNTWAMSLHNEKEPAFLSFVSHLNNVTVFSTEVQDPIGRIVMKGTEDDTEILCLATNRKFSMKIMDSETPASMHIADSEGRLIGVGSVVKWRDVTTVSRYSHSTTTTLLKEFIFKVENHLSEPTKVMLFVCFANWAKWTNDKIISKNRTRQLIFLGIAALCVLAVVLINVAY